MRCAGFHRSQTRRSFQPHVTLDYRHPPFPRQTLASALVWKVDHFMLVHSLYGLAKHEVLGCWPLVACQRDMFEQRAVGAARPPGSTRWFAVF